jgi:hypothetical protein
MGNERGPFMNHRTAFESDRSDAVLGQGKTDAEADPQSG